MRLLLFLAALILAPAPALAQTKAEITALAKQPIPPSFSLLDATADTSTGKLCFPLKKHGTLNNISSSVTFYILPGTAKAGIDYNDLRVDVLFMPADLNKDICVEIKRGTVIGTKTLTGKIIAGMNARLYDGTAAGKLVTSSLPVVTPPPVTPPVVKCDPATQMLKDGVCIAARWCAGGIQIPLDQQCGSVPPSPAPPPVTTPPTTTPPPTAPPPVTPLTGEAPVASNFDINSELVPAWGSGAIPPSASPDVVGAFRFICNAGQLLYDDPIVYPNQPGKSHLHQFYGNLAADASTTSYNDLRGKGMSSCMSPLNRSGYWMPAMLDGRGNVVRPDYVAIYYKRRPKADPIVSDLNNSQYQGQAVELPNGLKFIFGYDMLSGKSPTGSLYFNCDGGAAVQGHYKDIPTAMKFCPAGSRIGAIVNAPDCWDGRLDSVNHRDHVAYGSYGSWGYYKCPPSHPYVIPAFTLQAWFAVLPGDDLSKWQLSSDSMRPDLPHGSTFHADFFMAWDPTVKKMWHDGCIEKKLNCSGGDLGNGKQMKQFAGFSYVANPRLVPIP